VSEQFRYFDPIVVFVCSDDVKRDSLQNYILERVYRQLGTVAMIGVTILREGEEQKLYYTYEKLFVFKKSDFTEWATPFFDTVEDGKALVKEMLSSSGGSKYEGDITPVIYYGAPGTGKTRYVQEEIYSKYAEAHREFTTFHQSYSYEDFVEGLKPILDDSSKDVKYHIEPGVFYNACEKAAMLAGYDSLEDCIADSREGRADKFYGAKMANKTVLLCIDEINRGNVASIFGDLISLIEPSKRLGAGTYEMTATLPYSKTLFGVPANLFIVGTMNTADRSIQLLDSALRRRFRFCELIPDYSVFKIVDGTASKVLKRINARIRSILNKDNQIGHSYLMNATTNKEIVDALINKVIPLLEEYFYNEIRKVRFILNEDENTKYPFYEEDVEAKEAYLSYLSIEDLDEEDKSFYVVNRKIGSITSEEECGKYLKHLLGESE
jgi:5-methylcytosine-specific restriction protein B